jgi:hemolysin III
MHLAAAAAALIGLVVLLVLGHDSLLKELSLLVYGISLVFMLTSSALYHLVNSSPEIMLRLRKLDHSAIYVLIAGTYTPICTHFFRGFWNWGLLGIIWFLALAGIIIKMFVIKAPRWVTAGIYLVMGWLSVAAVGEMVAAMPAGALTWLVAGGLFYTVGAVVYIAKRPNFAPGVFGFHELWHIFVILGCLSHFILIAQFVA